MPDRQTVKDPNLNDEPRRRAAATFQKATSIGADPGSVTLPDPKDEGEVQLMSLLNPMGGQRDLLSAGQHPAALDFLRELLGQVFEGKGLNEKIRLQEYDPAKNVAKFTGRQSMYPYTSSMDEAAHAIQSGQMQPEAGPFEGLSLEQLVDKLLHLIPKGGAE